MTIKDTEVQENGDFVVKTDTKFSLNEESIQKLQIISKNISVKSLNNLNGTMRLPLSQCKFDLFIY